MALTITDNSVRQINAALLSLEKKIGETNSEKAQDKQVVQMELKNIQYNFMAPLYQSGNSVSINTTGTWEGNARSATNAMEGVKYYLIPDFSKFSILTVAGAMSQLFYSMSIAMGIMVTYGSYTRVLIFDFL